VQKSTPDGEVSISAHPGSDFWLADHVHRGGHNFLSIYLQLGFRQTTNLLTNEWHARSVSTFFQLSKARHSPMWEWKSAKENRHDLKQ
jgi:hypothetical protein